MDNDEIIRRLNLALTLKINDEEDIKNAFYSFCFKADLNNDIKEIKRAENFFNQNKEVVSPEYFECFLKSLKKEYLEIILISLLSTMKDEELFCYWKTLKEGEKNEKN